MTVAVARRPLVCATLILLPIVVLAGVWRLGGVAALEDDLIYYLPVRQYIAERIRAGEWPLWNPHVVMGTSVAADPQSGLWYPPTLLFVFLPPLWAYPASLVLHFAWAGGGMYRFLRACRHDPRAALLGAVAFEFCGYLVAHRAHLTIHHAVAWLPWMLDGWHRFAQSGRARHAALASAAFGAQLLVQHIQVSIITAMLVTAYAAIVLLPRRKPLAWVFPAGMCSGAMVAAVQIVPTWLHLAQSIRGTPGYYLFNENSWLPRSVVLLFFPMAFGTRTPNLWSEPWWGGSHFCEQWAYGTILMLILAAASWRLARPWPNPCASKASTVERAGRLCGFLWHYRRRVWPVLLRGDVFAGPPEAALGRRLGASGAVHSHLARGIGRSARASAGAKLRGSTGGLLRAAGREATTGWQRDVAFWWWASAAALLIALGDLTPVGRLLFQIPVYKSLRVPARWILVWSVAMPVLASLVLTALLRGGVSAERLRRAVENAAGRALPVVVALLLIVPNPAGFWLLSRLGQPSIWWPVLMMMVTVWALLRWLRRPAAVALAILSTTFLVDVASVAGFVDVDTRTYSRADLTRPPPLVKAIEEAGARQGDRLLVPRAEADYARPVEMLSPQYNLRYRVATFNGYGPLWPAGSRLLLRFEPWGASEEMVALLRNHALLRRMGVRFVAVRSAAERGLLAAAMMPPLDERLPVEGPDRLIPIVAGRDAIWTTSANEPGLYELSLDVEPGPDASHRWFVRLEVSPEQQVGSVRTLSPADLAAGARRMRFVFRIDTANPVLRVRVKSEEGTAVSAGRPGFRRIASLPTWNGYGPPPETLQSSRWRHLAELPGSISLYDGSGTMPLLYWAEAVEEAPDLLSAVERLSTFPAEADELPAIVEKPKDRSALIPVTAGRVEFSRPRPEQLNAGVSAQAGGLLVFNEAHDPGWRCWIDGQEQPVYRVNAVCQGILVPAGHHEVRFRYTPRGLRTGAVISVAGVLILAAMAVGGRWARAPLSGDRPGSRH